MFEAAGPAGQFFKSNEDEVHQTPDDKIPAGTVPYTGQKPDNKQIENKPGFGFYTGTAQGEVDIVPEPLAKGHMPSTPELGNRCGYVGVIKVFQEMKSEHFAKTDGHMSE